MEIDFRRDRQKWIVEVWSNEFNEPYPEDLYQEINQWCIETLKYHARTAYHIFELRTRKDLEWFVLRWS